MKRALQAIGYLLLYLAILAVVYFWGTRLRPVNPVTAGDGPVVTVIDASQPVPFAQPHRGLVSLEVSNASADAGRPGREGRRARHPLHNRCQRFNIRPLRRYRRGTVSDSGLVWLVEKPVESELDERTVEGDDHPARLFVRFRDEDGGEHSMEIIWANKHFQPGGYKYLHNFPHFVAQTGNQEVGKWVREEVDLLPIYRKISERDDRPHAIIISIFCDTDDTGTSSVAYFSDIKLQERGP